MREISALRCNPSSFLQDRASIAHAAGKPIILEETGMRNTFLPSRDTLLDAMYTEANSNDFAATLVWAIYAWPFNDPTGYHFDFGSSGADAVRNMPLSTHSHCSKCTRFVLKLFSLVSQVRRQNAYMKSRNG